MRLRHTILLALTFSLALLSCESTEDGNGNNGGEHSAFDMSGDTWLRGDFHLHSAYSNDAAENLLHEIVDRAQYIAGMDFFVVTDHDNHLDGDMRPVWEDPAYTDHDMILLYGAEYTTAYGHANIFGTAPWDHPAIYALRDDQTKGAEIVALAHSMGLHFSINHPTGKDFWAFDFDIGYDSFEVWNAPWVFPNPAEDNFALWDSQLRELDRKIPLRGGSDGHHHRDHFEADVNNIGSPTTWVHVEESTPEGILEALELGRASVSFAVHGERVAIWADGDLDGNFETRMGDTLPDSPTGMIALGVEIANGEAGIARTIEVYSHESLRTPVATLETTRLREVIELPAIEGKGYYRVQLRGDLHGVGYLQRSLGARVLGITNPVYAGY